MTETLMPAILKMSVSQRIALADQIWESVESEPQVETSEMLPGQKAELIRVIEKYTAYPELLLPIQGTLDRMCELK